MSARAVSLAIVIPTRNRGALAIAACESLLKQTGCSVHVFVSDNSTQPSDIRQVADYCARAGAERVTYLRPVESLPMPTHWDWALRTAMERSAASHFSVHYDRRITKPGHLRLIADVLSQFPSDLLTWSADHVSQEAGRSYVWQTPWDGRVYAIRTSRVVQMTIGGRVREMGHSFPILSNCAIPRAVLVTLLRQFESICDSTGPDSCFTYRFCATHDRYIHVDRAMGIIYAAHRSAGGGYVRGAGGDFDDFAQSFSTRSWLDAAPIPGLNLGQNMLFHEYELVRRATNNPAFTPVDREGYLRELGYALRWIEDPSRAAATRDLLLEHGWSPSRLAVETPPAALPMSVVRDPESRFSRLLRDLGETLVVRIWRNDIERRVAGILFLANYLRIAPEHICGFGFVSDQEAVRQALRWPRRRVEINPYLEPMQPELIAAPRSAAVGSAETDDRRDGPFARS